ncbi:hypothetical protein ACQEU5_03795 [Marinactinospora thermotolerans]|uniref:DUF3558 domain-containing protein n=1 Tax=Marinactinospora thermotolerans DSM 45154 TaxID=1122192 RepID=A0A1T4Q5G6_9ACTN|nr:hypothetical protein [Marinactinospora thermotolerans]SJZ98904.1 hypothetical protein SAMN02745673_02051 [Marinactinospora thermotolerans DSM 45154]
MTTVSHTPRLPRPAALAAATALVALTTACGGSSAAQEPAPAPSPSVSPSAASAPPSVAPLAEGLPATCVGSHAEAAVAAHTAGLPFGETAEGSVLACRWGAADSGRYLFVQFQSGETYADPEGADPAAEASMGVYTTAESAALGGKLHYLDLGSVGRSAVLYLPGVSVTANSVGMELGQGRLEEIVLAAAQDLP